jgi:hypothetical protein
MTREFQDYVEDILDAMGKAKSDRRRHYEEEEVLS